VEKCKHRTGVVLRAAALFLQEEKKTVPLLLHVIYQIRPAVSNLVKKNNLVEFCYSHTRKATRRFIHQLLLNVHIVVHKAAGYC
jgi:hypothetical protein